jgi:hypothetical protein
MTLLDRAETARLAELACSNINTGVTVWYGSDGFQVPLENDSGTTPFSRIVGIAEDRFLSLTDLYSLSDIFVRTIFISETPPIPTENWWVSRDDGATFKKLEFINYEQKLGSFTIRFRQKA